MNLFKYNRKKTLSILTLSISLGSLMLAGGCKKAFLEPDPLSIFDPDATFSTEVGLKSALAISDRHLRSYWTNVSANTNSVVIGTEYMFSDLAVYAKTDVNPNSVNFNFAALTPTSGAAGPDGNDGNYINHYWAESYTGIKYANTVIAYVNQVPGITEAARNGYRGMAYFHRAYRYFGLVFQYGDVPLVTKLLEIPKMNYKSTKKAAILDMITKDMEYAVEWVPEQRNLSAIGGVNKGACRMLLIKCYLATGQFQKAKDQADVLINQSGYSLMKNTFGTFYPSANTQTWNVTRNVIWDLHRPENKLISANTETIMGMPNRGMESNIAFATMRIFTPSYNNAELKSPDGKSAMDLYPRNSAANYRADLDFGRAVGRGIGTVRPTPFAQKGLWKVNNIDDATDLRHNSTVGNWVRMEDLKYTTTSTTYRGQNLMLRHPSTNALLCTDTIRCYFQWPNYKTYIVDVEAEANLGANGYAGATKGSVADWYLYRLAEAYLLRAEAKFYLGETASAADDVNEIRKRANCAQLYSTVTIGDIMDERARELYLEEWRHMELSRVSYCLALSGKPDEWGNVYNVNTYDKSSGTDLSGGSYWYKRVVNVGKIYNNGPIVTSNKTFNYLMDKCNLYWPIPNSAITANKRAPLAQNFGYTGYNPGVAMWSSWQEAVADEDKTE